MASGYKNPPQFKDGDNYETWKNELEIWKLVTPLEKDKMALAVALSLTGKAREAALTIKAVDLNKDSGMRDLIETLDRLFLKETIDSAYEAYRNFEDFRRTEGMSMSEFIMEFDQRYTRSKKYEMTLPDAVLAFKLLDNSMLSKQQKQLALTACSDIKFDNMKSALKRIFGESVCLPHRTDVSMEGPITVKQETAWYTKQRNYNVKSEPRTDYKFNKGTNPLNRYGKTSRCRICQSIYHWYKDCPHKSRDGREHVKMTEHTEDTQSVDECNITLVTHGTEMSDNEVFVAESFNSAVLDTACTRTVCGDKWLEQFLESIDSNEVVMTPSNKPFKFGDGNLVHSFKTVSIPARIGDTKCRILTEVVKADIPLLLSKSSLKKAGTVLDLQNDKAVMFDKPIKLHLTSSGHYCLDIKDDQEKEKQLSEDLEEEVLVINEELMKNQVEQKKVLEKLHKQFGHATVERLKQLIKSAGAGNSETFKTLELVVENCDICQKFKKPAPRPTVGLPLASDYNQTVAVDLHQLEENVWYLHILDEFSRFSAGCITKSKKASQFVHDFIRCWISIHGAPQKMFSDNGGEFENAEVRDMAENFNMEVMTTASYSPWSNGVLERHNQILTDILLKVKEEQNLDWETSLSWALMAKNSLQNVHGYSPYQIVFGRNPNLPSNLVDKPPALEGTTNSQIVGNHITALHAARQAYTKADCSERIRRALRKQTRPTPDLCKSGDKVYYKRPDNKEWKGPGVVIGQDGPVVFVRHGGSLVRVHKCRIQRCVNLSDVRDTSELSGVKDVSESTTDDHDELSDSELELGETRDEITSGPAVSDIVSASQVSDMDGGADVRSVRTSSVSVKPGQCVSYDHEQDNYKVYVKVLSRAGKVNGKNSNWFNVEYTGPENLKGEQLSVDLSKVTNLKFVEPLNRPGDEESVLITDDVNMEEAKSAELSSWKQNDVYTEVVDSGQKCISTRWVCTLKTTDDGIVPKARLVARGFEEYSGNIQKDSPTCAHESLRLIISVLAQRKWKLHSIDIKTAFLQGQLMDREVFIKPPKEAKCQGVVWRLNKCVYGLTDASLHWYNKVKSVMLEYGGNMSKVDPTVFFWRDSDDNVIGILACHVDDFIWGGTEKFEKEVVVNIRNTFKIGKEDSEAFKYCGISLTCTDGEIYLDQDMYTDKMVHIDIHPSRAVEKESDLSEYEKTQLRSKVGQLLWLSHQSRPDLLFDVNSVAVKVKQATVKDLLQVNKIISKAKSTKMKLKYQYLGPESELKLTVFSDASLGNLNDGGSQGGYVILLVGKDGEFSPIWWNSKKIRRVVRSTLAAETLSMADGVDVAIFIATLFDELTGRSGKDCLPLTCVTDCKSLFEAVKSSKFVAEKRLRMEISGIKELLENGKLKEVQWFEGKRQLADCLTKCGASPLLLRQTLKEGVISID